MGGRAGKGASGGMGSRSANRSGNFDPDYGDVNIVAKTMMEDLNMNPRDFQFGFNSEQNVEAQAILEGVASGDYGLASDISQNILDRKPGNRQNWSYGISEKQAQIVAEAAVKGGLVPKKPGYSKSFHDEVAAKEAAKAAAKAAKWEQYSSNYTKSSTKVAVGSRVYDSKKGWGTISKIITQSSGYVSVNYDSGASGKQMAFNLTGEDGNPLKKRPK